MAGLGFETKPCYTYCRNLLRQGIEDSGYVDDGKLVFGTSPLTRIIKNKKVKHRLCMKRKIISRIVFDKGAHWRNITRVLKINNLNIVCCAWTVLEIRSTVTSNYCLYGGP